MRNFFARRPAGTPAGGQFAQQAKAESGVTLLPAPVEIAAPDAPLEIPIPETMEAREAAQTVRQLHSELSRHLERATDRRPGGDEAARLGAWGRSQILAEAYTAVTDPAVSFEDLPHHSGQSARRITNELPAVAVGSLSAERCDRLGDHFVGRALYHRLLTLEAIECGHADREALHEGAVAEAERLVRVFYTRTPEPGVNRVFNAAFREVIEEAREASDPRRLYAEALLRAAPPEAASEPQSEPEGELDPAGSDSAGALAPAPDTYQA